MTRLSLSLVVSVLSLLLLHGCTPPHRTARSAPPTTGLPVVKLAVAPGGRLRPRRAGEESWVIVRSGWDDSHRHAPRLLHPHATTARQPRHARPAPPRARRHLPDDPVQPDRRETRPGAIAGDGGEPAARTRRSRLAREPGRHDDNRGDQSGARVFSFGIGAATNCYLLNHMAMLGRGAVAYVGLDEGSQRALDQFYERVSYPALTGPE